MSATAESLTILRPSQVKNAIRLMSTTAVALFIWGGPGISKSASAQQVATDKNIAFIDVRLSMLAPTDVIGMPYRVEENGETTGVAFTPPKILPRDIDLRKTKQLDPIPTVISFATLNPKGSNGIHYVKSPSISVKAINRPGEPVLTAEIVSRRPDSFVAQLVDADGNLAAGTIYYEVTGLAEGIVAFEELNSAPLATQQAAYQFILDRRAGEYIVPEGVRLIAMGNRQTDKGLTYVMPTPLANRFTHIEMEVDHGEWQEWAVNHMVHPLVVGYLAENSGELNQFNPSSASRGFATPRSWVFVSEILWAAERDGNVSERELAALIAGSIGDGTGHKFNNYRKIADKLPKVADILSGAVQQLPDPTHSKNPAVGYALTTSLGYALRQSNDRLIDEGISPESKDAKRVEWFKSYNRVLEFGHRNFQPEINVMGMQSYLTTHKLPIKQREHLPALTEFAKNYGGFIK